MAEIRALPTRSTVNYKVAELLQEMADLAKEGTIISFAATVIFSDNKPGNYAEANDNVSKLVGQLTILIHELAAGVRENSGPAPLPTTPA